MSNLMERTVCTNMLIMSHSVGTSANSDGFNGNRKKWAKSDSIQRYVHMVSTVLEYLWAGKNPIKMIYGYIYTPPKKYSNKNNCIFPHVLPLLVLEGASHSILWV